MGKLYKILLLLFSALCSSLLFGQSSDNQLIDSLKAALSVEESDTARANILNTLSLEAYYEYDYASANLYAEEALKLSQEIGFRKGIADAYVNLAFVYSAQGNYFEAKEFYIKAKDVFQELNDRVGTAGAFLDAGHMVYNLGNYPEALQYYLSALKFSETSNNINLTGKITNNIGNVHMLSEDKDKALTYYLKAQALFEKTDNKTDFALATGNVAMVYHAQGKSAEALEYYKKALKINQEINSINGIGRCYLDIGNVELERANYATALESFLKAQELFKQIDDKEYSAYTLLQLGQLYFHKAQEQNTSESARHEALLHAISTLETSTDLLKQLGLSQDLMKSLEILSQAYEKNAQYNKALNVLKLHSQVKDSLFNAENTAELTRIEMNHDFENKQDIIRAENDKQIAIRNATLASNKREKWFLFSGMLGLLIIGTLIFRQSRIRKKNNQKLSILNKDLEEANQIKIRFFSILNHDLRSPVSDLIHFLQLKKEHPELFDEESKIRLERQTMAGAENLLATMEDLLLWSKGQMEHFSPHPKKLTVESLFQDLKNQYSGNEQISFYFQNSDEFELFTDADYLKTILRNLTSNAIKVLHKTENPVIKWKALKENNLSVLSISDNGLGADHSEFKALYDDTEVVGIKSGLGLHLIRDLAKAIDCTITVNSEKGIGTEIVLKL